MRLSLSLRRETIGHDPPAMHFPSLYPAFADPPENRAMGHAGLLYQLPRRQPAVRNDELLDLLRGDDQRYPAVAYNAFKGSQPANIPNRNRARGQDQTHE